MFNALTAMAGDGVTITHMSFTFFLSLLPAWFAAFAGVQADEVRTVVVQEEVIMRVPVRPMPRRFEWDEHKGPKCISAENIRGAALSGPATVDFLLFDRTRLRAQLDEDCPALDFYNGFYLTPEEGRVCAKRDGIHSRMGRSCRIERFRRLVPKYPRD
jgi:hypothetical protein